MFQRQIGKSILEVSHKCIEHPQRSVYFNHIHNHCEILLFISGDADYNIDGQVFRPSPYDMLFIPAATYHYLIPTSSARYENYVIGISPEIMSEEHYRKLFSPPLMINIKDDGELRSFFSRLDTYNKLYSDEDFFECASALIRELLTYCAYRKGELNFGRSGYITYIEDIVRYISDNIEKELNADIIAHHFLLSKSYVQNIFSQGMHIGLKKYIMQKKIYSAHADIAGGMRPVDACEKYNFGDYSSFYRLYKKTFNISPSGGNEVSYDT